MLTYGHSGKQGDVRKKAHFEKHVFTRKCVKHTFEKNQIKA